jgi:hypothetical protein
MVIQFNSIQFFIINVPSLQQNNNNNNCFYYFLKNKLNTQTK